MEYPGNDAIPNPGSDYYTYAGEIPWSNKYARMNCTKRGFAKRIVVDVLEDRLTRKVRKRVDKLKPWERLAFLVDHADEELITSGATAESSKPLPFKAKYADITVFGQIPGFKAELPHYGFTWESHHSSENQIGSIDFIAPAICQAFDLCNRGDLVDLYDLTGQLASQYRIFGKWPGTRTQLLYIRKDLLEKYLCQTGQKIIWIIWGERSFKSEKIQNIRDELQPVWSRHTHIHKKLIVGSLNKQKPG